MSSLPTVELGDVLTEAQIRRLKTAKTAQEIREIVKSDASKYEKIFDPDYLAYVLMYVMGIYS